jgi:hypothetical protein
VRQETRVRKAKAIDAKEIERRRKAVERILELRRAIGPIGIRADELVHEARAEAEQVQDCQSA